MSNTYYLSQGNEVELFEAAASMDLPVLIKGPTGCIMSPQKQTN